MLMARAYVPSVFRWMIITIGFMLVVALASVQRVESKVDCNDKALADAAAQCIVGQSLQPELDKSILVVQQKFSQSKQAGQLEGMSIEQEEVFRYKLAIDELSELKRRLDDDDSTTKVSTFLDNDYIRVCTRAVRGSKGNKSIDQLRRMFEITRWDLWALEKQRQHLAWKLETRSGGLKWCLPSGDKGRPQKNAKKLYDVLVRQIAAIALNMHLQAYESIGETLQQTNPEYAKSRLIENLAHRAELLLSKD